MTGLTSNPTILDQGVAPPGTKTYEGAIQNWHQGMKGDRQGAPDGIVAFSQTDFTEDLITVPTLVIHGDDD